jgi:hypothetical protein
MSLPQGFLLRKRRALASGRIGGRVKIVARLPNGRTGFAWRLSFRLANGVSTSSDVPSRHPTRATAPTSLLETESGNAAPPQLGQDALLSGFAKPALHVNQPGVGQDLLRSLRLSGTNLHPKSNSVSIAVSENGEICAFKNLLFIRKTNGRIGQTMKLENTDVSTKELVATRAKRG